MGAALSSLTDIPRVVVATPLIVPLLGALVLLLWISSWLTAIVPYAGLFVGIIIFALLIGAMYAITNHAISASEVSLSQAGNLLRNRWLSLILVYSLIVISGIILSLLVLIPLIAVGLFAIITGEILLLGVGLVVIAFFGILIWFVFVLFVQFFIPAVSIDNVGTIDAVQTTYRIARGDPLSVIGFTLIRILLEWGPFLGGLIAAIVIGRDIFSMLVAEFQAILADPPTDPTDQPDVIELMFSFSETTLLLTVIVLLVTGGIIGEILRILYTTIFFRRITPNRV